MTIFARGAGRQLLFLLLVLVVQTLTAQTMQQRARSASLQNHSPAASAPASPTSASQVTAARPDLVFVQAPTVQSGNLLERFPQGSRIVRLDRRSALPVNLTPDFFSAADPQVSFDGSKALFAAKEDPTSRWQVWEMNSDGAAKRQVTHCAEDCLRPAYLPRNEIVFTAMVKEGGTTVSQLFVSKRDGADVHPITFGPGDYELETVLQNGLVLASARSPLLPQGEGEASREFYTLRPDGSGLATFRCDHRQPALRSEAAELDDGSLVFVKQAAASPVPCSRSLRQGCPHQVDWHGASRAAGGELAMIRRGALHNSPLGNPPVLAYSPKPLSSEKLAVARRALGTGNAAGRLDLYAFDVAHGKFTGLIYQDPTLSSLAAVPVAAHTPPRWYWSTLNPALKVGYFICLDSYRSDAAPGGRFSSALTKVRVLTLDPVARQEHSLGEAPVEQDGSFYIAVPPDRPVRFELLEAGGGVIRAQRSWIWTRPGEERGCIGCHEDRALAPENRWPLALHKLDTPVSLGVKGGSQAAP
jgi:hypothetical protein